MRCLAARRLTAHPGATAPDPPARPPRARRALPAAERSLFTITLLNGPSHGLLLFMLSSGLTLIFSRMGVLNSRTRRSTGSVRNSRTR